MSDVNVSDVLSEASTLYQEINEADAVDKNIESALDTAEEVGASTDGIVAESMSSVNLKLLKLTLEHALGFDIISELKAGIKLEDGSNPTQTSMIQESIKAIVKDFWVALKNSFNKLWARLKTWYITATSASEALVTKASKIKSRAEKTNGTIKERNFELKNYKAIHKGGKVSGTILREGLKTTKAILEQAINVRRTKETEDFIEASQDALEDFTKSTTASTPDSSWCGRFSDLYTPKVSVPTSDISDAFHKEQIVFDPTNADYKVTDSLLGNKRMVFAEVKAGSTLPMSEKIGLIYGRYINDTKKEYSETTVRAETLHTVHIIDICDTVIELNENISFYEKAWQRRDKFMTTVIRNLDKSIEKIDNDDDVVEGQDAIYKKTTRSILSAIKRSNTYNASILNNVLAISNGALTYCEASLGLYETA